MDANAQSPEELDAHYSGVVAAAWVCLDALLEQEDWAAAWATFDAELRLARAQAWIWNNRTYPGIAGTDLDLAAEALTRGQGESELWDDFARIEIGAYLSAYEDFRGVELGAASRPRPVAPDYEVVLFAKTAGEVLFFNEPTLLHSISVLMHHTGEEWRVAHLGSDQRAVPGWPPEFPGASSASVPGK